MVVAGTARKSPALNGFPEFKLQIVRGAVYRDDAALGTVKRFMGRTGDNIGPFLKGLLKIGTHQPQHMGHVVHQHAIQLKLIDDGPQFSNRLFVNHHAFAQNNQFRPVFDHQFPGGRNIDFKGVVFQHRKVHHRRLFPLWIAHDKIPQRPHGLGAQVSAFDDVIVHHFADAALFAFAVGPV